MELLYPVMLALPCPPAQVLLEVCPHPRKGVYSAQLGKLATAAQRPPGVLLQASEGAARLWLPGPERGAALGPGGAWRGGGWLLLHPCLRTIAQNEIKWK